MAADEEPDDGSIRFDTKGTVIVINADGPEWTDAFEVEGGMPMIFTPKIILLPRTSLDLRGKAVVTLPEIRRDGGIHRERWCGLPDDPEGHGQPFHRTDRL